MATFGNSELTLQPVNDAVAVKLPLPLPSKSKNCRKSCRRWASSVLGRFAFTSTGPWNHSRTIFELGSPKRSIEFGQLSLASQSLRHSTFQNQELWGGLLEPNLDACTSALIYFGLLGGSYIGKKTSRSNISNTMVNCGMLHPLGKPSVAKHWFWKSTCICFCHFLATGGRRQLSPIRLGITFCFIN